MTKWMIVTLALALAASGCTSDEPEPQVQCERIDIDDTAYCTYAQPITETGYDCPQDLPNAIPFEGGTVCGAEEEIPPEHEEPIREHFDGGTDIDGGGGDAGDGEQTDGTGLADGGDAGPLGACFEVFSTSEAAAMVQHSTFNWGDFGVVEVGGESVFSLYFSNFACPEQLEATEFEGIEWASGSAPADFEVTTSADLGSQIFETATLTVTYRPTSPGIVHDTLHFKTRGATYSFELLAEGIEPDGRPTSIDGDCIEAPASIDFGSTSVGNTVTKTITLERSCEVDFLTEHVVVETAELTSSASDFAVETAVDNLVIRDQIGPDESGAPAPTLDIEVSFTPSSSGAVQETLDLTANDATGSYSITLTGTGDGS